MTLRETSERRPVTWDWFKNLYFIKKKKKVFNDDVKKEKWKTTQLTVSGFLSNQRLSLPSAVDGVHADPVTCLRCEAVQNRGGGVSPDGLLTSLFAVQRLPGDPILADSTRGRNPGGEEAGVRDVSGLQVSR